MQFVHFKNEKELHTTAEGFINFKCEIQLTFL